MPYSYEVYFRPRDEGVLSQALDDRVRPRGGCGPEYGGVSVSFHQTRNGA